MNATASEILLIVSDYKYSSSMLASEIAARRMKRTKSTYTGVFNEHSFRTSIDTARELALLLHHGFVEYNADTGRWALTETGKLHNAEREHQKGQGEGHMNANAIEVERWIINDLRRDERAWKPVTEVLEALLREGIGTGGAAPVIDLMVLRGQVLRATPADITCGFVALLALPDSENLAQDAATGGLKYSSRPIDNILNDRPDERAETIIHAMFALAGQGKLHSWNIEQKEVLAIEQLAGLLRARFCFDDLPEVRLPEWNYALSVTDCILSVMRGCVAWQKKRIRQTTRRELGIFLRRTVERLVEVHAIATAAQRVDYVFSSPDEF